jgi:hypothetical protein
MNSKINSQWFLVAPIALCFAVALVRPAAANPTAPAAAAAAQGACTAPEYRALDFTLGTWSVVDGQGDPIGTSKIESEFSGCVVVENWVSPDGSAKGRNIDAYSNDDKQWHRLFIDNRGHVHNFEGTAPGAKVEYQGPSKGPNGEDMLNRLTIEREGADKMRQLWEKSSDGGKTWQRAFQGVFTRVKN